MSAPADIGALQVRAARPAEMEALHAIDALTSPAPISIDRYRRACTAQGDDGDTALVVHEEGEVKGYVLCSKVLDEVTILNIAVAPRHQGQGLGGLLLDAALRTASEHGARRCLLEVRISNLVALALYRRYGFTEDGVRKGYYPGKTGREDALMMSKEL